jgi:prophage antirepressor-like protein
MNQQQLTPVVFNNHTLTPMLINNEPWFIAKDVCDILDLGNPTKALYVVDADEKTTLQLVRAGKPNNMNVISESGLYKLIFKSRKPDAMQFTKWVASELLPSIRKTGKYAVAQPVEEQHPLVAESMAMFGSFKKCFTVTNQKYFNDKLYYKVRPISTFLNGGTPTRSIKANLRRKLRPYLIREGKSKNKLEIYLRADKVAYYLSNRNNTIAHELLKAIEHFAEADLRKTLGFPNHIYQTKTLVA